MKCSNMAKQTEGENYNGWYDLFGFATSGYKHSYNPIPSTHPTRYQPWEYFQESSNSQTYLGYGPVRKVSNNRWETYDLTGSFAKCDWGVFNDIINDGPENENMPNKWRVMKGPSWQGTVGLNPGGCTQQDGENQWLLRYRTVSYARFGYFEMNVRNDQLVRGVILYPDEFALPWEFLYNHGALTNNVFAGGTWPKAYSNSINEAQWSLLEYKGAMFWPAAGISTEKYVSIDPYSGYYDYRIQSIGERSGVSNWTSSHYVSENTGNDICPGMARATYIGSIDNPYMSAARARGNGTAVRLVQDAN